MLKFVFSCFVVVVVIIIFVLIAGCFHVPRYQIMCEKMLEKLVEEQKAAAAQAPSVQTIEETAAPIE
jgi:hypothetical protein